jgi:hypothetical protein
MNIPSLISSLFGVVSGGWGSAVAAIVVVGAAIYFMKIYRDWQAKILHEKTENQSAVDQQNIIISNQNQSTQIISDEAASEASKPKKP